MIFIRFRAFVHSSGLRSQHCHCRLLGHCCGADSIPDLGTSTCPGHSPQKKKKKNLKQNFPAPNGPVGSMSKTKSLFIICVESILSENSPKEFDGSLYFLHQYFLGCSRQDNAIVLIVLWFSLQWAVHRVIAEEANTPCIYLCFPKAEA